MSKDPSVDEEDPSACALRLRLLLDRRKKEVPFWEEWNSAFSRLLASGASEENVIEYMTGVLPSLPQDPGGSVRSDLPIRWEEAWSSLQDQEVLSLRAAGPTPAAAYFRWKAEARRMATVDVRSIMGSDVLRVLRLKEIEVLLEEDVADGRSDEEAMVRATEATEAYLYLLEACRVP
jgi:hypothetical protein